MQSQQPLNFKWYLCTGCGGARPHLYSFNGGIWVWHCCCCGIDKGIGYPLEEAA